ncbi:DNA polymerase III subunit delta [bacterium]|nr:DNA polymerase III subunit delta [bacterium]
MQKLYHGKNTYLSLRSIHELLTTQFLDNDIITIDADSTKVEKIIDTLYSPSLFNTQKIYFLKRVYKNKEKEILIKTLFEILDNDSLTILIWEDQKIRSNTKYFKFFKERNSVDEFPKLNKRSFVTWARKETEQLPFTIPPEILNTLSQRSNYEPERFNNNLDKLKLLETDTIDQENLNQTVADTLETDIWKLMDYINISDHTGISNTLEKLLEYKTDPHYILAMIARNLRIAIQTKDLLDNNTNERLFASILKLPPFAIYPVIKSVRNTNRQRLLLQYKKLCNLDYKIKTGRIEPTLGLSLFTLIL